MTLVTDNPHAMIEEVFAATRAMLPLYGDGRGGYLLSAERDGDGVLVRVGRLDVGRVKWTESAIGEVRLDVGDDVEATLLARLPDLPRCSCGCGSVVRAAGLAVFGHVRPRVVVGGTCRHGHELTDDSIYTSPKGQRECRTCRAEKSARVASARREAA